MILTPFVAIAGGLLFAAISFFFALAETALFSLEKWETRRLAETGGARGKAVAGLLSRPQDLLATIVFGNTLANAVIVVLPIWVALREGWSLVWTPLILLTLILVGCEVIPKALAVRAPERWALAVGRPMSALQRVSQPLRGIAQWLIARMLRVVVPKSVQTQALLSEEE
jgi:Mg2+/Co2+ transporter CorB